MSTTSNSVPAGKENSILTVLSVSEVAEYLEWERTGFMNCLMTVALRDSVWGLPGRSAEWLWRIIF